jgi:hypothetical protein
VEFEVDGEMFAKFKNKFYDPTNPISEIGQFRLYLKDELEYRLTEFPGLGYEGIEGDNAPVKIAVITFAYHNEDIIRNLSNRGWAIKMDNYKNLDIINNNVIE